MSQDPREAAARYRLRQDADAPSAPDAAGPDATGRDAAGRTGTAWEREAYVETAIAQAIRAGAFDDLPGAGKPIPDLGDHHDPDWWIRRKIQTEQLTGLGPPALTLRVEHARMPQTLDALTRETEVRELVEDFNRRVVDARRQLLGGPPVVTPTRDVEAEVTAWRERRAARERERVAAEAETAAAASARRRRWFRRR